MATSIGSQSDSRSPVSVETASSTPDRILNATIFGINRLSIRDRPKNIIECLEADRTGPQSRIGQLYRQLYLSDGLAKASHMYSTDVRGHHGCVNTLAFSNEGEEFLVSAGDDQRVLVWRVVDIIQAGSRSPKPIIMTSQHSANVFTSSFSCNNEFVYSGGDDAELTKHDFNTGQPISHYEHLDAVYSVAPHPSSPSIVLTASEDGCVYTIDTRQPHRRVDSDMMLCESTEAYHCAVFNPVEPRLVAVCNSYTGAALYDTRYKKRLVRYRSTTWPIVREDAVSACFDGTGQQLYVMHRVLPPCLYDLYHEEAQLSFMDNTGSYKNVVTMKSGCFMGQNDEYVVSGSDDFRVYIWKIPNSRGTQFYRNDGMLTVCTSTMPHLILPGHRSIVNQTCYSKVHHILATSGVEKIIKVWSHENLNSSQKISKSRAPPSRSRYSSREQVDHLMNSSPADPLSEDASVLALFDSLIEEGEGTSDFYNTPSSADEETPEDFHLREEERRLRHVLLELPFFGHHWSLFSEDDGDTTTTDSEVSNAATSSLEPPWWSDDDMESVDEELWIHTGSDDENWGRYGSNSEFSTSDEEEENEDGRVGRISNHHDDEVKENDRHIKGRKRAKSEEPAQEIEGARLAGCDFKQLRKGSNDGATASQLQPTRCQPSRKVKKVAAATSTAKEKRSASGDGEMKKSGSSSAASCSRTTSRNSEGCNNRRQPKRKVKSAQKSQSATSGCHDEVIGAMNSEPFPTSSNSCVVEYGKSGPKGKKAVANGSGENTSGASGHVSRAGSSRSTQSASASVRKSTDNRNSGNSSNASGRGSRAVANGNSEPISGGSGPSRRWTRKRNRRQREASGTAADNYHQYRPEDFLKTKSPTSFYANSNKKDPP